MTRRSYERGGTCFFPSHGADAEDQRKIQALPPEAQAAWAVMRRSEGWPVSWVVKGSGLSAAEVRRLWALELIRRRQEAEAADDRARRRRESIVEPGRRA